MPTRAKSRGRGAMLFVPRVEALEDRRLLAGGAPLSPQSPCPPVADPSQLACGPAPAGSAAPTTGAPAPTAYGGHTLSQNLSPGGFSGGNATGGFGPVLVITTADVVFAGPAPAAFASADRGPARAPSRPADGDSGSPPSGTPSAAAAPGGTGGGPDWVFASETRPGPSAGPPSSGASGAAPARGAESARAGALALAAPAPSAAPAVLPLVVSRGDGEADTARPSREVIHGPRAPLSPGDGGARPEGPEERGHEAAAPDALPRAAGPLTEGLLLGVGNLGRAVEALVDPTAAGRDPTAGLYWLGVSSWLLAAALAWEAARRGRARRAERHPSLTALPPETDL